MKKPIIIASLLALLCAFSANSQDHFIHGTLTTANSLFGCTDDAMAEGTFVGTYDTGSKELSITVMYNNITSTLAAAHIHVGDAATNGGVAFDLTPTTGATSGFFSAGPFILTDMQEDQLIAGELYVNLHSVNCAPGVIRDQISVTPAETSFSGTMTPGAAMPPGGCSSTSNTGSFTGYYNYSTMELVVTDIDYSVGTDVTVAHIHNAPVGANGGVEFDIDPYGLINGTFSGNDFAAGPFVLSADQHTALLDSNLYINIHDSFCAGGALRDQIRVAAPPEPGTPIPTMGQWGIIILSFLLLIIGVLQVRNVRVIKEA